MGSRGKVTGNGAQPTSANDVISIRNIIRTYLPLSLYNIRHLIMLYYICLPQHVILIADQKIMKPVLSVLQSRSRPCHSLHSSAFDWLILKASYKLVQSLDWFSKRLCRVVVLSSPSQLRGLWSTMLTEAE